MTAVISFTVVLLCNRVPRPAARAAATYLALIVWMLGLLLIDGGTRQGVQFITVQIGFVGALLIASTSRTLIGTDLDDMVARSLRLTSIVLIGTESLGAADSALHLSGRVTAIVSLVCMAWFLAEYRLGRPTSLWWSLALLLGIAITLSRTALLAGFVIFALTMFLSPGRRRVRNSILCVLVAAGGVWAITSWAPLHDRFVQGDLSLSVGGINVNTEGRTAVWSVLWSGVQNEPLIGHGPGSASALAVSLDPAFDNPHDDYLRILYDFGTIGLGLFAWSSMRSAKVLWHARKKTRGLVPMVAALNAGLAVLIMMATDNPLDYPVVLLPLGALIGLGLAAASAHQLQGQIEG
jgi:O-antigen ligase